MFLHTGGSAAVAAALHASASQSASAAEPKQNTLPAPPTPEASGRPVKFASVGVGIEGSILLRASVKLPNAQCVAACDVYDDRHTLAREIAGQQIVVTRDYKQLLADPQIEAIVLATPDHQHAPIAIEAVRAGKDVYCEKPMSHSIADGEAMVKASQASGRIIQAGSQRVSSPLFLKARELCQAGAIGPVRQVDLVLGRNSPGGAWEYPVPLDLSPANLDWPAWIGPAAKKDFDPITFARWRCFGQYGTGVAGDLMVHLLSGMQFVTGINQMPDLAFTVGGIVRWPDGRNMPDLMVTTFLYGEVPVSVRLTLGTDVPETTRIMGPKGMLEVSANTLMYFPQTGADSSPDYGINGFPAAMHAAYEKQWHAEHAAELAAHPLEGVQVWHGASWDDHAPHLNNFFTAVRTRGPVPEDVVFGHHAAAGCHMANASYFEKRSVHWDGKKVV